MMEFRMKAMAMTAAAVVVGTSSVMAQSTLATISGRILDDQGQPAIGATVTVKNEATGFSITGPTDVDGYYNLRELPLGDDYTVTARYIGFGDQVRRGYALNQGDKLRLDFRMSVDVKEIKEVEVVANSLKKGIADDGASKTITLADMAKLPVNGRNFTSLMDLSPLANGNKLSGQLESSTGFAIDGMSSKNPISGGASNTRQNSPYAMSMEAIREFKVVTNAYDVTYGRVGGGLVNAVSKSGTNVLHGSAFGFARANWLSSPYDINGRRRDNDFSTYQYGFTLGGPIIKNRLHFFVAWDHQQNKQPLYIAHIQRPADEARYNLSQATLDRYIQIAQQGYGLSASQKQYGSFDKNSTANSVFARLDWQISPTNLLTLRNNLNLNKLPYSQADNSAVNLLESYSDTKTADNSLMLTLRSILSPTMTNEAKGQWMYSMEKTYTNGLIPSPNIPRAIVERVTSDVGGKTVSTTIQLGGQRFTPENFHDHVFQFIDNLYWNHGGIDYTFGVDLMYSRFKSHYGSETNGRFYFTGLDNFASQSPYRYARDIFASESDDVQYVNQNILNLGLYAQAQKRLFAGFDLMLGLRLDEAAYLNAGKLNDTALRTLGIRTDNKMNLLLLQPRAQLTWDIGDRHRDIVKLGAGIFASDINNYATINNQFFDGSHIYTVDIQGAAVPRPDFASYRRDPATAPGMNLFDNPAIEKTVTINYNSKDAQVPVIYKANISYSHYFSDNLRVGVSGYMTLARHNYMYHDVNIVDEPYFRIPAEANRGVYVPAESINPANGATNWMNGRKTNELGRVLQLDSDGKVNQFALVIDGTWRYYKDGQLSVSYTWNDARDNTSYNGNVANSATLSKMVVDDPREMSRMSYSNGQFRHKLVAYATLPTFWGITCGIRFSGIGGTRYSLVNSGNVNGDFVSSNDLAYVYDPNAASTPLYLKEGINAILDNPSVSQSTKNYIRNSFGKVAERNGGVNGFYGTFDLHLGKTFRIFGKQRIEATVDLFNVANLLNKNWDVCKNIGQVALYSVKGFDPAAKEFKYIVNTNAGYANGTGNPYQFQIGLRAAF